MTDRTTGSPEPLGPEEAERIVLGGPVRPELMPVARLIEAARGGEPVHDAGLEPVLDAFRAAEPRAVSGRRWLVAKIAVVTAGFSIAGTAAAAGVLPSTLQRAAHSVFGPLGVPAPTDSPTHAPATSPAVRSRPGVTPAWTGVPTRAGLGVLTPSSSASPSAHGKSDNGDNGNQDGNNSGASKSGKTPPGQAKKTATPEPTQSQSPGKGHSKNPGVTHGKQGVHSTSKV